MPLHIGQLPDAMTRSVSSRLPSYNTTAIKAAQQEDAAIMAARQEVAAQADWVNDNAPSSFPTMAVVGGGVLLVGAAVAFKLLVLNKR